MTTGSSAVFHPGCQDVVFGAVTSEEIPKPELHAPVALFFAVFGLVSAHGDNPPEPHLQIGDGAVVEFGCEIETPVIHGHDDGEGRGEVENVKRFFLGEPQIEVVLTLDSLVRIWPFSRKVNF